MKEEILVDMRIPVDVIGEIMYYRNNSTGKPTLIHFIDESLGKSYCGFDSFGAELVVGDDTDTIDKAQCCKKCLKQMLGMKQLRQIQNNISAKNNNHALQS